MSRTLPNLSKLLSPWGSAGPYQTRVTLVSASNDEHFDLRQTASPLGLKTLEARPPIRRGVLLSSPSNELRYIDGSILVRHRDH